MHSTGEMGGGVGRGNQDQAPAVTYTRFQVPGSVFPEDGIRIFQAMNASETSSVIKYIGYEFKDAGD